MDNSLPKPGTIELTPKTRTPSAGTGLAGSRFAREYPIEAGIGSGDDVKPVVKPIIPTTPFDGDNGDEDEDEGDADADVDVQHAYPAPLPIPTPSPTSSPLPPPLKPASNLKPPKTSTGANASTNAKKLAKAEGMLTGVAADGKTLLPIPQPPGPSFGSSSFFKLKPGDFFTWLDSLPQWARARLTIYLYRRWPVIDVLKLSPEYDRYKQNGLRGHGGRTATGPKLKDEEGNIIRTYQDKILGTDSELNEFCFLRRWGVGNYKLVVNDQEVKGASGRNTVATLAVETERDWEYMPIIADPTGKGPPDYLERVVCWDDPLNRDYIAALRRAQIKIPGITVPGTRADGGSSTALQFQTEEEEDDEMANNIAVETLAKLATENQQRGVPPPVITPPPPRDPASNLTEMIKGVAELMRAQQPQAPPPNPYPAPLPPPPPPGVPVDQVQTMIASAVETVRQQGVLMIEHYKMQLAATERSHDQITKMQRDGHEARVRDLESQIGRLNEQNKDLMAKLDDARKPGGAVLSGGNNLEKTIGEIAKARELMKTLGMDDATAAGAGGGGGAWWERALESPAAMNALQYAPALLQALLSGGINGQQHQPPPPPQPMVIPAQAQPVYQQQQQPQPLPQQYPPQQPQPWQQQQPQPQPQPPANTQGQGSLPYPYNLSNNPAPAQYPPVPSQSQQPMTTPTPAPMPQPQQQYPQPHPTENNNVNPLLIQMALDRLHDPLITHLASGGDGYGFGDLVVAQVGDAAYEKMISLGPDQLLGHIQGHKVWGKIVELGRHEVMPEFINQFIDYNNPE